ncbi:hypothetical protein GCM10007392_01740 [Saccharospirillum salsuginis]|uniref:Uncharacterized protein n=1 Tax=Saccharospirillum salsuginis TaxID=418750 RepID=A0A918K034_9GAMM|nr:hypothetical protein GCM10007392_01740 [Saccharospirillum salsuginis]
MYNEHESLTTSPLEQQQVSEQEQHLESEAEEPSKERDTRQAGRALEADDSVASTDVPKASEPPTNDSHRYTLGREQTETPTQSSGSPAGQREAKPPRLHIGEVVIRVEENPKPQRAKRRGRTSTLSDSQRLIRSL